jgi:hypothetical protein
MFSSLVSLMMKISSSLANDETFVINFITCRLLDWSSYVLYFHVLLQIVKDVFEGREMMFYMKLVPPPTNLFSSQSRVVSPKNTANQIDLNPPFHTSVQISPSGSRSPPKPDKI